MNGRAVLFFLLLLGASSSLAGCISQDRTSESISDIPTDQSGYLSLLGDIAETRLAWRGTTQEVFYPDGSTGIADLVDVTTDTEVRTHVLHRTSREPIGTLDGETRSVRYTANDVGSLARALPFLEYKLSGFDPAITPSRVGWLGAQWTAEFQGPRLVLSLPWSGSPDSPEARDLFICIEFSRKQVDAATLAVDGECVVDVARWKSLERHPTNSTRIQSDLQTTAFLADDRPRAPWDRRPPDGMSGSILFNLTQAMVQARLGSDVVASFMERNPTAVVVRAEHQRVNPQGEDSETETAWHIQLRGNDETLTFTASRIAPAAGRLPSERDPFVYVVPDDPQPAPVVDLGAASRPPLTTIQETYERCATFGSSDRLLYVDEIPEASWNGATGPHLPPFGLRYSCADVAWDAISGLLAHAPLPAR